MRFGDRRKLAIDIEPVSPSWERRSPSDRGPWARLAIWVDGENLCRHWLPSTQEISDGVHVPLAPIADWLVQNAPAIAFEESARAFPTEYDLAKSLAHWKAAAPAAEFDEDSWEDQRFAWSERHFLLAGADGSWLPNLALARADETLWVSASSAHFATPGAPIFTYEAKVYAAPWEDSRRALSDFVDEVGEFLRREGLVDAYPWSAERGPPGSPGSRARSRSRGHRRGVRPCDPCRG